MGEPARKQKWVAQLGQIEQLTADCRSGLNSIKEVLGFVLKIQPPAPSDTIAEIQDNSRPGIMHATPDNSPLSLRLDDLIKGISDVNCKILEIFNLIDL